MRSTTKRKPPLDLGSELRNGDGDSAAARAKQRRANDEETGHKSRCASSSAPSKSPSKKKEKEFAWMDSDAESSVAETEGKSTAKVKKQHSADDPGGFFEDGGNDGRRSNRHSRKSSKRRSHSSSSEGPPLPASVSEVETFSQMVRMVEALKKRVRSMACTEMAECLAAAARVKFFDASFLQDLLIPQIKRQLTGSKRKSPFGTQELVTILCALGDLNCFDQTVFTSSVRELADRRYLELQSSDRRRLLVAFKAVHFECNDQRQFKQWLSSSVQAERYEALSAEQRMIVGNSKNGMHAPEGYLRSFMIGQANGSSVGRPHGLSA